MAKKKEETPAEESKKAPAKKKSTAKKTTAASSKTTATTKKTAAKSGTAKTAAKPKAAAKKAAVDSPEPKPIVKKSAAKPAAAKKAPAKSPAKPKKPAASDSKLQESFREIEETQRELPLEYDDTKIVLLVRDPEWIFAYWELSRATRQQHGLERGHHKPLVLRVFEGRNGHHQDPYDVVINDYTSSWYLRIPASADSYHAVLGVFDDDKNFVSLAESNQVRIPRMGVSEDVDVEFAEVNDEIYEQILHLSGGVKVSERLGSDEFLKSLQQRIFDTLFAGPFSSAGISSGLLGGASGMSSFLFAGASGAMTSGMFSGVFSSEALSSAGFAMPAAGGDTIQAKQAQKDDFWLEVGVDVIVYGATEPDAKVKFMGQDIELARDGTFRFRMVFPDTTIEFPVEAVSANGKHLRKVKPIVTRTTEGSPHDPEPE